MLREIDKRFNITAPLTDRIEDTRRASHLRHTYVDLIRQRGRYKELADIERAFRTLKSTLEIRPQISKINFALQARTFHTSTALETKFVQYAG